MADPTFNEVLREAVESAGEVYADDTGVVLTNERAALYRNAISQFYRLVSLRAMWPEQTRCERRYFADVWSGSEVNIPIDAIRYTADANGTPTYYVALQAQATAAAVTDTAFWAPITSFVRRVPLEQTGKTRIGTPLAAWHPLNPRVSTMTYPVDFTVDETGIVCPQNKDYVWLIYRLHPDRLTAAVVGDGTTYTLPERMASVVALRAAASICRAEGKPDRATELDGLATDIVDAELDDITAFTDSMAPARRSPQ